MNAIPDGFRVGHWTNADALTGCTVVLCPSRTVGACDVRGSSPGSRELALLDPVKTMQEVHAVLLTGGSAFGLAAADGVMKFLEEQEIGYQTPWVKVPIVAAAVVFDLNIGSVGVRPTAESGYLACRDALSTVEEGSIGAGTGATVGKWAGVETRMKGGVGFASVRESGLIVAALAVVNAVGDIINEDGSILAGAVDVNDRWLAAGNSRRDLFRSKPPAHTNTTLAAVMTNARLTKVDAHRVADRAHDGMARAIIPVHTSYDGDIVFTLASGPIDTSVDLVAELSASVVAESIRSSVLHASSAGGVVSLSDLVLRRGRG